MDPAGVSGSDGRRWLLELTKLDLTINSANNFLCNAKFSSSARCAMRNLRRLARLSPAAALDSLANIRLGGRKLIISLPTVVFVFVFIFDFISGVMLFGLRLLGGRASGLKSDAIELTKLTSTIKNWHTIHTLFTLILIKF